MKALLISGSRNAEGKTARMGRALLQGLAEAGVESEEVFLPQMEIERCRQCDDDGWGICRTEGRCIIEDDFAGLALKIAQADALVFTTPVYFSDLAESLRGLLDRLRRVTRHEDGQAGVTGKPAVGICVAGGGGGGAPHCAVNLERILQTCGFDVVDMIPVRRQNMDYKQEILRTAGRALVAWIEAEE